MDRRAYTAARSAAAVVDHSGREWLRVTGEDRISFLHGMVTNDVKGLADGKAVYAALLTAKGAMVADARLWRRPGDLLIDVEPGFGAKVKEALEKFLISEDAELHEETAALALIGVVGPKAREHVRAALGLDVASLAADAFVSATVDGAELWAIGAEVPLPGGVELLVPRAQVAALLGKLTTGAPLLDEATAEVLRVESGVPRYGADMDEKTIPLEANLERALHYNKGCYIGQEVVARATFRGHVNRKLTGLLLGTAAPAARTDVFSGERRIGWVTSVVASPGKDQNVALAYVHRDFLEPGTALTVGGAPATVHPLPLVPVR